MPYQQVMHKFKHGEDVSAYETQIRKWRQLKLMWENFQNLWYSEVAHDWRVWDQSKEDQNADQSYYDKPINVFKAYLESIIAALSITIPPIRCYPDDADNSLDISTAKAGDKIGTLIYRHNDAPLLWLHSLFITITEGMVAAYTYPDTDKEYGTYEVKEHEDQVENHQITTCPICGYEIDDTIVDSDNSSPTPNVPPVSSPNEMANNTGGIPLPEGMEATEPCPACGNLITPLVEQKQEVIPVLLGVTNEPKSRVCIEVYGGLHVKIPNHCKKQKDVPYLLFSEEKDYSIVCEMYEHLTRSKKSDKTLKIKESSSKGGYSEYSQWGRLSPQYMEAYPENVVTINKIWIRPAKYNILADEDMIRTLKKEFPDGACVVFCNDQFCEAYPEKLDERWTLSVNPLADFLHFEPLAQSAVNIQDITNDIIALVLQTIEHGIGQTFADPAVLGFKQYEQTEVTPGGIFPATPKSGKSLSDGFFELKTATLSQEVLPFFQNIQSLGQVATGALPSLFGGQLEGSETASQYSMSRAQALQRLQNTWKMLCTWWKNVNSRAIPIYVKILHDQDGERDVQKDKDGNFINVVIRKADLLGKIGKMELEANENLPITWSQRRDTIEKMLTAGNPELIQMIAAPENLALVHEYLGLEDFYVPGEDDVNKQYDEIQLLLQSEPLPSVDPLNPEGTSSIPIDPIFDNNQIEFETVRKWAISEVGRQTKVDNPTGYQNVLLHGKEHNMALQQAMMQQAMAAQPPQGQQGKGAPPGKKPSSQGREAPITSDSQAPTIQ
jgi:hypothetical protein